MFLVSLQNMAYTKDFSSISKAIQFMKYCGFESILMHKNGDIIGKFNPISGQYSPID